MPYGMYNVRLRYVLLFLIFICNILKFLEQTLAVTSHKKNRKESYWMDEGIFPNQSTLNPLCSGGHSETVRVCSLPSQMKDFGNTKRHDRVLVFRFNSTVINIFLSTRQVSLPDASISYRTGVYEEIPVYREEISKGLYIFYEGNLIFYDYSLPFTASWDGINFKGKTFVLNVYFEFVCTNKSESSFYMTDHCFYCNATCTDTKSIQTNNTTFADQQDLFDMYNQYPDLEYIQTKSQLYRKNRHSATFPPKPLSCVLHLVADHLFYKFIGQGSIMKTLNVIFGVVNDADALFRSTDFDGDQHGDNIGFIVGKVTVFPDSQDLSYNLSEPYLTADHYLKQFSYFDFSDYCLGLAFTYREFYGLAGSSYQAYSDKSLPGGICQERMKHNFDLISLNTAFITFLNFGQNFKESQVVLILTHELGHSFGASHDMTKECLPGSGDGDFLMSSTISFGALPNNPRFSACSIRCMLPVIKKKGSCLIYGDQISICGNSVPEIGEECDCGTNRNCHKIDPCCTPADVENSTDKPCTVRRSKGKLCSPTVNPCCTDSCTYIPLSDRRLCNNLYDCSRLSVCDGMSGHCPYSDPLPDGTACNKGFQVCSKGICSQAVCEYHNLTSCVCTQLSSQCKLCCMDPRTLTCEPANMYRTLGITGDIDQDPGEQCYNNGICDLSLECINPSNIFVKSSAILGFRTLLELETFVKKYWLYFVFTTFCTIFTVLVILLPYHFDDSRYIKALRYGKMMAVFATGEHQTKIYRKNVRDIDEYYTLAILRLQRSCEPKDYIEALGRLKLFFPEVQISYLSRVAKLSASESTAVKILLLHGFKLKTLSTSEDYFH